jgi:hypothetical protein
MMGLFLRMLAFLVFVVPVAGSTEAVAEGCNIANVLFGSVRIEIIKHSDYETGIVFGNDFDSERFRNGKILGKIEPWGTASSTLRRIENANGDICGVLTTDLTVSTDDAECANCNKQPFELRKVSPNSYAVVLKSGKIVGTIEGRLPKP